MNACARVTSIPDQMNSGSTRYCCEAPNRCSKTIRAVTNPIAARPDNTKLPERAWFDKDVQLIGILLEGFSLAQDDLGSFLESADTGKRPRKQGVVHLELSQRICSLLTGH